MNRRGFISLMAGAGGALVVPWRQLTDPVIVLPPRPRMIVPPLHWTPPRGVPIGTQVAILYEGLGGERAVSMGFYVGEQIGGRDGWIITAGTGGGLTPQQRADFEHVMRGHYTGLSRLIRADDPPVPLSLVELHRRRM